MTVSAAKIRLLAEILKYYLPFAPWIQLCLTLLILRIL